MTISFPCGQCSKIFTVDAKYSGKKGRCKSCGALMLIPSKDPVAILAHALPVDPAVSGTRPATPLPGVRGGTSRPQKPSSPARTEVDVFGLEAAPLPPRAPVGWSDEEESDRSTRSRRRNSWAFSSRRSDNSLSDSRDAVFFIMIRIILAVFTLGGSSLAIPGVRSSLIPGWAPRSEIETVYQREIELMNEVTAAFQTVQDIPTATAASSRSIDAILKLEQFLTQHKGRKGNKKDIEDLRQKYGQQQAACRQSFEREFERVESIPGAFDAMGIRPALTQLASVASTIPNGDGSAPNFIPPQLPNFNPPRFVPSPTVNQPPNFNPQPNSNPLPNFNRPPSFTPPPRLGNPPNFNRNPPMNRPGPRGPRGIGR